MRGRWRQLHTLMRVTNSANPRSPSPAAPTVDLVDLSVTLGGTRVLSRCNLTLRPGESLGVAGPNGAGKSTLLATIATFIPPTGGEGRVLGVRLGTRHTPAVRPRIGWSGHLPALYRDLTLGENLAMAAQLGGHSAEEGHRALQQMGLGAAVHLRTDRCSNGMQRRADLARLLIGLPSLILLDEPDAGLDREAASVIGQLIQRTTSRGAAALCVSHDPGRLSDWTDRVMQIREGRIE